MGEEEAARELERIRKQQQQQQQQDHSKDLFASFLKERFSLLQSQLFTSQEECRTDILEEEVDDRDELVLDEKEIREDILQKEKEKRRRRRIVVIEKATTTRRGTRK